MTTTAAAARTPLLSLKRCAADEFESCESSLDSHKSPTFGIPDDHEKPRANGVSRASGVAAAGGGGGVFRLSIGFGEGDDGVQEEGGGGGGAESAGGGGGGGGGVMMTRKAVDYADNVDDRKSSVNSPILTAGRLSFAPSCIPPSKPTSLKKLTDKPRRRKLATQVTNSEGVSGGGGHEGTSHRDGGGGGAVSGLGRGGGGSSLGRGGGGGLGRGGGGGGTDYVASIDQMVKDIFNVIKVNDENRNLKFQRKKASPPATNIITKSPRDYKRRSLTARGGQPPAQRASSIKLPDLLRVRPTNGSHSARLAAKPPASSSDGDCSDTESDHQPIRLERRLSLSKRADDQSLNSTQNDLSRALWPESQVPPLSQSAGAGPNPRCSMDPFLLDTSPSPPTTPFKSALRTQTCPFPASLATSPLPSPEVPDAHRKDEEFASGVKEVSKTNRDRLTSHYYAFYNELIFENKLPKALPLEWNARFLRVSGRTTFRKIITRNEIDAPVTPRVSQEDDDVPTTKSYFRSDALDVVPVDAGGQKIEVTPVCISLSVKLLTTKERLQATLLHEMCHVAQMLLEESALKEGHHGKSFHKWLDIAQSKVTDIRLQVNHDYSLDGPHYRWSCLTCSQVYQRPQNSINCDECVCNACQGKLTFLGRFDKKGKLIKPGKKPTAYNQFVKENYPKLRAKGLDEKAIRAAISDLWKDYKNVS